jgi:hypothetical protein
MSLLLYNSQYPLFSLIPWLVLFMVVETTWWCQEMPTAAKPRSFQASFGKGLS